MHGSPSGTAPSTCSTRTSPTWYACRSPTTTTARSPTTEAISCCCSTSGIGAARALLGYGATDYDRETCWRDYLTGMLQAPVPTAMLASGCQAIRELGSLDLVRAL